MIPSRRSIAALTIACGLIAAACAPSSAPSAAAPTSAASASEAPAPPPSDPALAPTPVPPGIDEVRDTRYTCSAAPGFLPSDLDRPANAELEDHPTADALQAAIAEEGPDIDMLPESGYWLLHRDDRVAEYLARGPGGLEPPVVHASIEFLGGAWTLGGWGQCRPTILLAGRNLAEWILDPAAPAPGPDATTFTVLVTERTCTGGKPMGGRLQAPSIIYGNDVVLVVFTARPLEGDGFDCPGNPSTRAVVQLREPLGERRLLDAGFFPPAEPVAPAF